MLKSLGEAGLAVGEMTYPDDELEIGPSNPKGLLTLFVCRKGKAPNSETGSVAHGPAELSSHI